MPNQPFELYFRGQLLSDSVFCKSSQICSGSTILLKLTNAPSEGNLRYHQFKPDQLSGEQDHYETRFGARQDDSVVEQTAVKDRICSADFANYPEIDLNLGQTERPRVLKSLEPEQKQQKPRPPKPTKFRRSPSSQSSRINSPFSVNSVSPHSQSPTSDASFFQIPVASTKVAPPKSRLYEELKAIRTSPVMKREGATVQVEQSSPVSTNRDALFDLEKQLETEKLNNLKIQRQNQQDLNAVKEQLNQVIAYLREREEKPISQVDRLRPYSRPAPQRHSKSNRSTEDSEYYYYYSSDESEQTDSSQHEPKSSRAETQQQQQTQDVVIQDAVKQKVTKTTQERAEQQEAEVQKTLETQIPTENQLKQQDKNTENNPEQAKETTLLTKSVQTTEADTQQEFDTMKSDLENMKILLLQMNDQNILLKQGISKFFKNQITQQQLEELARGTI